jgi:hypothetical protein
MQTKSPQVSYVSLPKKSEGCTPNQEEAHKANERDEKATSQQCPLQCPHSSCTMHLFNKYLLSTYWAGTGNPTVNKNSLVLWTHIQRKMRTVGKPVSKEVTRGWRMGGRFQVSDIEWGRSWVMSSDRVGMWVRSKGQGKPSLEDLGDNFLLYTKVKSDLYHHDRIRIAESAWTHIWPCEFYDLICIHIAN